MHKAHAVGMPLIVHGPVADMAVATYGVVNVMEVARPMLNARRCKAFQLPGRKKRQIVLDKFDDVDYDKSGGLSFAEVIEYSHKNGYKNMTEEWFKQIDHNGNDLSDYYPSVEWDIMSRIGRRRSKNYPSCCPGSDAYVDIMYFLVLRRKPLFYTVNLVFPCVGISFLTILVFYLPSKSGEKVTLCISILVALTIFFLLLTEIIPATSISLPLIGKYLLFTMVMVSLSIMITVVVLNLHFRTPTTHRMSPWVKFVFLKLLPSILFMRRPLDESDESFRRVSKKKHNKNEKIIINYHEHRASRDLGRTLASSTIDERMQKLYYSPPVVKTFENICFIAELLKKKDRDDKVDEDWKYVAMVVDRLFLLIFSVTCFTGTCWILLQAPTLYDNREAIDLQYRPSPNITLD
uniref:Neurotransmitter-gated ion-channel transmembrane domain-containing protein n=1 Tax=Acrobeloides nanus TaxID=290746 RepID=A0A914DLA0_9BILA